MLDSARGQKKCASESPEKVASAPSNNNNNNPTSNIITPTTYNTTTTTTKPSSKSLNGSYKNLSETADGMQVDQDNDVLGAEFEGIVHRDTKNFATTMRMLDAMRKSRHLCDLVLQLDNDSQDIYCHQIILACNSKFFMEIFTNYERENQDVLTLSAGSYSTGGVPNIERSLSSGASTNGNGSSRQSPGLIDSGSRKKSVVELVNR